MEHVTERQKFEDSNSSGEDSTSHSLTLSVNSQPSRLSFTSSQADAEQYYVVPNMERERRMRRPNFTDQELKVLTSEVHKHRSILFRRLNGGYPVTTRQKVWQEIADKVNAVGCGVPRTVEDIRRKWSCFLCETRKKAASKTSATTPGGNIDLSYYYNMRTDMEKTALSVPESMGFDADMDCEPDGNDDCDGGTDDEMKPNFADMVEVHLEEGDAANISTSNNDDGSSDGQVKSPISYSNKKENIVQNSTSATPTSASNPQPSTTPLPPSPSATAAFLFSASTKSMDVSTTLNGGSSSVVSDSLVSVERRRLEIDIRRLLVEEERLRIEKRRLQIEEERLRLEKQRQQQTQDFVSSRVVLKAPRT